LAQDAHRRVVLLRVAESRQPAIRDAGVAQQRHDAAVRGVEMPGARTVGVRGIERRRTRRVAEVEAQPATGLPQRRAPGRGAFRRRPLRVAGGEERGLAHANEAWAYATAAAAAPASMARAQPAVPAAAAAVAHRSRRCAAAARSGPARPAARAPARGPR